MRQEKRIDKRVESLRAFLITKNQLRDKGNLTFFNKGVTEADIVTMSAFKAIYHLGIGQLLKFMKYIGDGAEGINEYAVQYYCTQLKNGPLYRWVKKYSYNFKIPFWRNPPDIYGCTRHLIMTDVIAGNSTFGAQEYGDCKTLYSEITSFRTNIHNTTRTKIPIHMQKTARNMMVAGNIQARSVVAAAALEDQWHQFKPGYLPGYNFAHGGFGCADLMTFVALYQAAYKPSQFGEPTVRQMKNYFKKDYGLHEFNLHANPYWPRARPATPAFESIIRWTIPYYVPEDKEIRLDKYVTTDLSGKVFMSGQSRQYTVQIPLSARPGQTIKEFKLHTITGQFGSGDTVFEDPLVRNSR